MIKNSILYLIMISLILLVGFVQSWNVALLILNMCIISSIMSLGVNIQYGYAAYLIWELWVLLHLVD